ncbi:MAG: M20/M25/M40 family metallo-hydrolase [Spirochaeta sp.]|nr:M20/M25/M40 family metallo-hydrolase [Spirochaeta sp.]
MSIFDTIREKSEAYAEDTAAVLSHLVRTKSYGGEEGEVLKVVEQYCQQYNFDEVRFDGLGNLIARVGEGSRSIAFDAHVDTVEIGDPDQWTRDPFSGVIEDGWLHGRGSSDQKGGAASMLTAGRILKANRTLPCLPNRPAATFTVVSADAWRWRCTLKASLAMAVPLNEA